MPAPTTATRVSPQRVIIRGEPGTTWTNDTGFVQSQLVCSMVNTCGACLQYHLAITRRWGIPLHFGCNCSQVTIKRDAEAPHEFCDYRKLLDEMTLEQQVKAIGGANYRLLKEGLATWDDIVTRNRVRTLQQVVARNKITVRQMVDAGVRPDVARRAYETVHTPEADLIEAQRRELFRAIQKSGIAQDVLVEELGKRLAARVIVAPPPSTPPVRPTPTPAPIAPGPLLTPVKLTATAPAYKPTPLSPGELIPPRPSPAGPAPIAVIPRVDPRELAKVLSGTKLTKGTSGKVEVRVPPAPKPAPPPVPAAPVIVPKPVKPPRTAPPTQGFTGRKIGPSTASSSFIYQAEQRAADILGRPTTPGEIASMVGAPAGATVEIRSGHMLGTVAVHVFHPEIQVMERTIRKEGDKVIIHNDVFKLKEEFQGSKIGLKAFAMQVENAQAAGVSRIETEAFRSTSRETFVDKDGVTKEKWAGYYVWPSYGYNGPLKATTKAALKASELPAILKTSTKISQLMADDAGKAWWKEHGIAIDVKFDLKPGSYSVKTLDKYLQKKMPVVQ